MPVALRKAAARSAGRYVSATQGTEAAASKASQHCTWSFCGCSLASWWAAAGQPGSTQPCTHGGRTGRPQAGPLTQHPGVCRLQGARLGPSRRRLPTQGRPRSGGASAGLPSITPSRREATSAGRGAGASLASQLLRRPAARLQVLGKQRQVALRLLVLAALILAVHCRASRGSDGPQARLAGHGMAGQGSGDRSKQGEPRAPAWLHAASPIAASTAGPRHSCGSR